MTARSKTVLIVEDEPLIAMGMEELIRELGYVPCTAHDINEAVTLVEAGGIDLGILDYSIRDGDSEPVAKALRLRRTPFIVCSGAQFEKLAEIFEGALFVSKPYCEKDLQVAVLGALAP